MKNFITYKKFYIIGLLCIFFTIIAGLLFFYNKKNNGFNFNSTLEFNENNEFSNTLKIEEEENKEKNEEETIYVHIIGEVKNAGLVELKEGSRIINAIEAAGGITEKADLSKVNLAYILSDGSKVNIPSVDNTSNTNIVSSSSGENIITEDNGKISGGKVNINTANQAELETVPGIGPSTALKIIEYRVAHGKFKKIEDLKKVEGIGEAKFNNLKNEITV